MSLIKKKDVAQHFAARRALKLANARIASSAAVVIVLPGDIKANASMLAEDFSRADSASIESVPPKN